MDAIRTTAGISMSEAVHNASPFWGGRSFWWVREKARLEPSSTINDDLRLEVGGQPQLGAPCSSLQREMCLVNKLLI